MEVDEKSKMYTLTLLHALGGKEGDVKLVARNGGGEDSCTSKLTIGGRAPEFIERPLKCTVLDGNSLLLRVLKTDHLSRCSITTTWDRMNHFFLVLNVLLCFAGSTAVFRCRVDGDPTPTVVWQKGKWRTLENNKVTRVYVDENTGTQRSQLTDTFEC